MDQQRTTSSLHEYAGKLPAPRQAIPVAIQPRDLILLKTIYELPYCDAAQLSRLIPIGAVNPQLRAYLDQRLEERARDGWTGGEGPQVRRSIVRRLQQLLHAEGGPYIQQHILNRHSRRLYTIAPRSVDLLAAEFDLDSAALARTARNKDVMERYVHHSRMRTGFRFALTVAVSARPDVAFEFWFKDGATKIGIMYHAPEGTVVRDTVIPDEFLGLRWGGKVETLPIETDKRRDYKRVKAKMIAYVELWRQIRHGRAKLPLAPPHVVRQLRSSGQLRDTRPVYTIAGQPVLDFRVLWVAKGIDRMHGLRRLACEVGGPHGVAAGLFLFTHEAQYIDQPERVFAPIWQKARNEDWRQLLT
jgi:hypothetical protein